jgi:DNA modification methylase
MYRNTCGKCSAIRQDAQLGLEPTPEEYVANMVAVFREVWRVLRDDGTLFLNLGDSYNGSGGAGGDYADGGLKEGQPKYPGRKIGNLKPKDLVGIPWRLAFALQADGWYLRSDIIWSKPNPMPESVTDRPTKAHEYVFLLTKQARYYYDAEAVREDGSGRIPGNKTPTERRNNGGIEHGAEEHGFFESQQYPANFRNRRTVWTIATQPYSGAHFATFPEALVEPCVKAGTSERGCCPVCGKGWRRVVEKEKPPTADTRTPGRHTPTGNGKMSGAKTQEWINEHPPTTLGWLPACEHDAAPIPCTVFDPFAGSGTVGVVAQKLGRSFTGLELSLDYIGLANERIAKANGYHVGRLI